MGALSRGFYSSSFLIFVLQHHVLFYIVCDPQKFNKYMFKSNNNNNQRHLLEPILAEWLRKKAEQASSNQPAFKLH